LWIEPNIILKKHEKYFVTIAFREPPVLYYESLRFVQTRHMKATKRIETFGSLMELASQCEALSLGDGSPRKEQEFYLFRGANNCSHQLLSSIQVDLSVRLNVSGKAETTCCWAGRRDKNVGHEDIQWFVSTPPEAAHRRGPAHSTPGRV
jgi:hypothetical protein